MPFTPDQFSNFGASTVAGGAGGAGTSLVAGDTSLLLATGDGAKFPSAGPFMVQLGTSEVAKCTARSGDTLTLVRGQESTTAATWIVGSAVTQAVTAGNMANLWSASPQVYNVYAYGAKGDGTTDDTAAIQAAITAAGSGITYLPPGGTFLVSSTLTMNTDGARLCGGGRGSKILTKAGFPSAQVILVTAPSGSVARQGIHIMDLLIQNTANSAATGIELQATYQATIERVHIEGVYAIGIYLNGSVAPNTYLGAYTHIRDCHIGAIPSGATSGGIGILTSNHEFNIIEGNTINWFKNTGGVGVKLQNSATIIRGNTFDECETSVWLYFCNDAVVHANEFDRVLFYGVRVDGAKRARITDNSFLDYSGLGTNSAMIYVVSAGADCLYRGNTAQTGKPWVNAVQEASSPADAGLYLGNHFGGYGVVRLNGIFRSNQGYNPVAPIATPAAAPSLATAGTGGTIAAGTYGVKITYVNIFGETIASAAGSIVTSGTTSTITITAPDGKQPQGNAYGWYAYVTQAGGATYTRQQTAGSPTALGNNLVLTAPPSSGGATAPVANTTAGITAPAVPASTVAAYNTFGVDCTVYVSGGTVTAISIGGTATGLTSGAFKVMAGQAIAVTYSVAPTWVWAGE